VVSASEDALQRFIPWRADDGGAAPEALTAATRSHRIVRSGPWRKLVTKPVIVAGLRLGRSTRIRAVCPDPRPFPGICGAPIN
jgi:hypothetical protein